MEPENQITDEMITGVSDGPNVLQNINVDERTIEFIISSETIIEGRGYIVRQNGLDLSAIKKNPVFLWMHDAYGYSISGGMPVGKILTDTFRQLNISTPSGKVKATAVKVKFPKKDESELGDQIFKLYAAGYLNAVSIGFRVMQITEPQKSGDPREFTKWKMYELSGVAIGADDEALVVKRAQTLNRDESEARQMFSDLIMVQNKVFKQSTDQDQVQDIGHFIDVNEQSVCVRTNDEEALKQVIAEIDKLQAHYNDARPALLEANKAMVKFFKMHNEKQPDDLLQAYVRMNELMEKTADKLQSDSTVTVVQQETPAAQPASKPGVVIPQVALQAGLADIREQCAAAALEASAKGMSTEKVQSMTDALYKQLCDEFFSKFSISN